MGDRRFWRRPQQRGRSAAEARDDAVRAGASINGLPMLSIEPDLEMFFCDNAIGGPGGLVIAAASFATVADAILKKLIIEISHSGGMVHCRCARFALQPDPRLGMLE